MEPKTFDYSIITDPKDREKLQQIGIAVKQLLAVDQQTGREVVEIGRQLFRAKCLLSKYDHVRVAILKSDGI